MNDNERIARGQRAAHELTETEAAFQAVEAAILREIGQTPIGAETKVLNLHRSLHTLAAVRQAIRAVIDDGRMAQEAIAQAGLTRVS